MEFKSGDKVGLVTHNYPSFDYGIILCPCPCGKSSCNYYLLNCYDNKNRILFESRALDKSKLVLIKARENHPLTTIFK
jgi:hypothetical protein